MGGIDYNDMHITFEIGKKKCIAYGELAKKIHEHPKDKPLTVVGHGRQGGLFLVEGVGNDEKN